jgi:putative PEP-CTERM system TPR-repeat lipoprotein
MTIDQRLPSLRSLLAIAASTLLLIACGKPSDTDAIAKAKAEFARNDTAAALITLKAALQERPDSAALRFMLGKALQTAGDAPTALVELRKALELGHAEAEVLPELVKAMAGAGRGEEAIKQYGGKTLDDKAAMAELQVALASAWGTQGRIDEMRQSIDKALALDPQNITAMLVKARLVAAGGDLEAAARINDQVLQRDPKNAHALHLKGRVLRYARQDVPGAMAAQRAALEANPKLMSAHAELLDMLFVAKDKQGMRQQMQAMQNALPQNINTFLFRAQMEFLDNNLRAARELVQQLLRAKQPDTRVLLLAARIELGSGAPTLAETYLKRVLSEDPTHASARELLTVTYLRMGDSAKALATVQPLVEVKDPPARLLALAGEAYLQGGSPAKAQAMFERAAKGDPDDKQLRTAAAVARVAQGKVEEGLADLGRIAETDTGTSADLALVTAHMVRRDVKSALASVARIEQKQPDQARFAHIRGQIQMQAKDPGAARKSFVRSLELDPTYFPAAMALAALDISEKKPADARKHFESMLTKDPRNWRAQLALADLHAKDGDREGKVLPLLQDAVKQNPTTNEPRVALVEYHLAARRYDMALSAAQEALAVLPDTPGLLDGLGRAQIGTKEYQQAITTFRKLATLLPNSPLPHMRLAETFLARNDRSAARASLQRALEAAPNLAQAQVQLVEVLLAEKQYKEAMAIARSAQQARPREGLGHELEAAVLIAQKQLEPAIAALRQAMSRTPTTDAAVKLHATLTKTGKAAEAEKVGASWVEQHPKDIAFRAYLGLSAMSGKDWLRAERHYREVVAAVPGDIIANNNLAWALMNQKKPGALPFAEAANKLSPNNPALMDTLAMAMADAGQVDKAMELQKKVVDMAPQLMEAKLNLARIAIKSGNKALARGELEKLTYEGDKFPLQAEVQQLLRSIQ